VHSERSLSIFFIIFERMHGMQQDMCQIMIYSYSGLERNTNLFVKHWNERQLHAGRHYFDSTILSVCDGAHKELD
jgi:hypothetical protein